MKTTQTATKTNQSNSSRSQGNNNHATKQVKLSMLAKVGSYLLAHPEGVSCFKLDYVFKSTAARNVINALPREHKIKLASEKVNHPEHGTYHRFSIADQTTAKRLLSLLEHQAKIKGFELPVNLHTQIEAFPLSNSDHGGSAVNDSNNNEVA